MVQDEVDSREELDRSIRTLEGRDAPDCSCKCGTPGDHKQMEYLVKAKEAWEWVGPAKRIDYSTE